MRRRCSLLALRLLRAPASPLQADEAARWVAFTQGPFNASGSAMRAQLAAHSLHSICIQPAKCDQLKCPSSLSPIFLMPCCEQFLAHYCCAIRNLQHHGPLATPEVGHAFRDGAGCQVNTHCCFFSSTMMLSRRARHQPQLPVWALRQCGDLRSLVCVCGRSRPHSCCRPRPSLVDWDPACEAVATRIDPAVYAPSGRGLKHQ